MEYIAHGIILQVRDLKDEDRLYRIFTFERGLINAIAKSVASTKSKLSGFLLQGNHCIFMLAQGKNFDKIAQVKVEKSYNFINNYECFFLLNQTIEILLYFLEHSAKEINVYNSTINFLDDLSDENLSLKQKRALQISYFSDIVKEFGFMPNWFNLSQELNNFLDNILKNNYLKNRQAVIKLDMKEEYLIILKNWFKHYLESVLERKLNSL